MIKTYFYMVDPNKNVLTTIKTLGIKLKSFLQKL